MIRSRESRICDVIGIEDSSLLILDYGHELLTSCSSVSLPNDLHGIANSRYGELHTDVAVQNSRQWLRTITAADFIWCHGR